MECKNLHLAGGNNDQTLQKNDFIMCQIASGILFCSEWGCRPAFLLGTRILWNISLKG